MNKSSKLTPSLEDYLEAILQLERKNRVARVKDIASHLQVQMPSVTGALKNLKAKGMIEYEKNSFINLTEEGMVIAESVYEKHNILLSFFQDILLLDETTAEKEGCMVEHNINMETALRIKNLHNYLKESKLLDSNWENIISKKQ